MARGSFCGVAVAGPLGFNPGGVNMLCSVGIGPPIEKPGEGAIGLVIGAVGGNPIFAGGLVIGLVMGGFMLNGEGDIPGAGVAVGLDIGDVIGCGGLLPMVTSSSITGLFRMSCSLCKFASNRTLAPTSPRACPWSQRNTNRCQSYLLRGLQ